MGLSSILLPGENAVDKELDQLFTAKPPAPTPTSVPGSSKVTEKKRKATYETLKTDESLKRLKHDLSDPNHASKSDKPPSSAGRKKLRKVAEKEHPNSEKEDSARDEKTAEGDEQEDDGEDEDESPILHESLKSSGKRAYRTREIKAKYVPPDETPLLRDERTIFVGNLPIEVAQNRPLLKQLQRHILSQIPSAKIESTRFRSVPFQSPTAKLPDDASKEAQKPKSTRSHDLDRTSAWRTSYRGIVSEQGEASKGDDKKRYLTSSQKKKIAFINHEFHSTADTVNAYVVFAHPVPAESRPANLPPPPDVMNPYKAAKRAARVCDGSIFLDRAIRVDVVGKAVRDAKGKDREKQDIDADADMEQLEFAATAGTDPKLSVFVGSLDFASKEEDLRNFFETVIRGERGEPPVDSDEDTVTRVAPTRKSKSWVSRVRIIRDKDTQMGKGFAYVQFVDRECVDEILGFEPGKLKFAKRKLRVQRCRTTPGSALTPSARKLKASKSNQQTDKDEGKPTKPLTQPINVPKGDPSLGEKLLHLPKEERKRYKSADRNRVARRLAKKKARMAMTNSSGMRVLGKERQRERVTKTAADKRKVTGLSTVKKRRVRSEKSLAKRNGKKQAGGSG